MNIKMRLFDNSVKHIKNKENNLLEKDIKLEVVKEERFSFQLMIDSDESFFCQLNKTNDIHYLGLNNKVRIEIKSEENIDEHFDMSFIGYIKDDNGEYISDQILNNKSQYVEQSQLIWVEGKIPKDFENKKLAITINIYYTKGYEKETLINSREINIDILDYTLPLVEESDFFLDLWQHPCNWARQYKVDYYSEEHFTIIENFLSEMSKLGQKVIDLIVTDYPWAGQKCYEVFENASNLFETNIVKVSKENGNIICDFTNLDRYVDICLKYKINKEINLFGLIGNWDAFVFGSPLEGYRDAIRVSYYNKDENVFDYIKTKDEFKNYLSQLFKHLESKGLLDISKIICDEPDNDEIFKENAEFIQSCIPNKTLKYKCAIHHQEFFERCDLEIEDLSLNTCELINNIDKIDLLREKIRAKNGYLTWYSCCFPNKLNVYLSSPLIESRLIGWFTYYFNLDGFLRWAYGVWPKDVFNDASYKKEKWKAGDMFFVYPGENMKPMDSVRVRNLLFGIQDFIIFRDIEKHLSKKEIMYKLEGLLGKKEDMKFLGDREVHMDYSLDYEKYLELRNTLLKSIN